MQWSSSLPGRSSSRGRGLLSVRLVLALGVLASASACAGDDPAAGGPPATGSPAAASPSGPSPATAPPSGLPRQAAPVDPAIAAALEKVDAANQALEKDFAWVNAGLSGRESLDTDPDKLTLFSDQRKPLAAATQDAREAVKRARAAAQESPRDCSEVVEAKAEVRSAVGKAEDAYDELRATIGDADDALDRADDDREQRDEALADLQRLVGENPEAGVPVNPELLRAQGYDRDEEKTLSAALDQAKEWAVAERALASRISGWAELVAPSCG